MAVASPARGGGLSGTYTHFRCRLADGENGTFAKKAMLTGESTGGITSGRIIEFQDKEIYRPFSFVASGVNIVARRFESGLKLVSSVPTCFLAQFKLVSSLLRASCKPPSSNLQALFKLVSSLLQASFKPPSS